MFLKEHTLHDFLSKRSSRYALQLPEMKLYLKSVLATKEGNICHFVILRSSCYFMNLIVYGKCYYLDKVSK